ncbi:hypothetical protein [Rothia nasimurium]|uniref:hypothetical protein n=1 Tax=Rothia nasimurium TaxID=85336 RepID=UPI002DD639AB|nr:hypothetical protein [Rothia nasimurium]
MSAEPRFPTSTDEGGQLNKPRLSVVRDEPQEVAPARRPLSRSRALRATSNRWRVFVALGAMLVALLTVLVLSIVMASRQYDLVELRAQEQALIQQNEALAQEIEFHQAPQDLAIRASQLGLVAASSQATLDLQTGEITGTPLAAVEGEAATKNLIAPPALADTQAYEEASARAEEQRKKEEAEAKASAEASASAAASASAQASAPASASPAAQTSAQPSAAASAGGQ